MLKIERIELREIRMPLVYAFETSFGRTVNRRIILARVIDTEGAEGWGECTAGEHPFYSEEWTDAAWSCLCDYLAPHTLATELPRAEDFHKTVHFVRGNRMAKATLETALWDLEARRANLPLWKHLGGTQDEIKCGVSIGIQPTVEELLDKIALETARGYQRIKIKIKPDWDVEVVRAVRRKFPDVPLMVDANSAYTLADTEHLQRLDEFDLMMVEQPLAHDDIDEHAALQKQLRTSICLDESVHSRRDTQRAIDLQACRIINIKLGRVGGHTEAKRIEAVCREANVPVWCGGMLESGIGRAHNIALSTLAGFTLPGDVSASERYWEQDVIEPTVQVSNRGTIAVSDEPGIGYGIDLIRIELLTIEKRSFSK